MVLFCIFPGREHTAETLGSARAVVLRLGMHMEYWGTVSLFGSLRQLGNPGYEAV